MAGKSINFYQNRIMAFEGKWNSLADDNPISGPSAGYQLTSPTSATPDNQYMAYCKGESPMWQAQLHNRILYVKACIQLPGSC